jgi:hypothetical protein
MGSELFRIDEAGHEVSGLAYYKGLGLRGQEVYTHVATVLRTEDQDYLRQLGGA